MTKQNSRPNKIVRGYDAVAKDCATQFEEAYNHRGDQIADLTDTIARQAAQIERLRGVSATAAAELQSWVDATDGLEGDWNLAPSQDLIDQLRAALTATDPNYKVTETKAKG